MVEIVGYNKFRSKNNGNYYISVFFTYSDSIDYGVKTGSCIAGEEYFDKLMSHRDSLAVGYDKERKSNFLYIK